MAEPILVVDFGTCFSSAAVVSGGAVQLIREPASGSFSWPSAVYADEGRLLVGSLAASRRNRDPARWRSELKRYLGQDDAIILGNRSYLPLQLVTAILTALKTEADRAAGVSTARAVLSVPASYGRADQRRTLTITAAEAAGLSPVELLTEPVAAVFAPVIGPQPKAGELILVYDFGGGTFDTALVRIGDADHAVLGSDALDDCGGVDLDAILASRLAADADRWLPSALSAIGGQGIQDTSLRLNVTFGEVAHSLKHQLSDTTEAEEFVLPGAPSAHLSRAELTLLTTPLLDRTVECCRGLLERLKVSMPEVSAVLTVGGSTRMPAVANALEHAFGRPLRRAEDPDLAVVQGAAQWACLNAVRTIPSLPSVPGSVLLRWMIPPAQLVRWLIPPGVEYQEGAALARIRYGDGTIWNLCASRAGCLEQVFASPGDKVSQDSWLAIARE